ncbi:aminoacyl-tRNA hydrolase [Chlamydia sp. 17-3921]|uniref:aminoacyl-tRNA hydrolase n=1 Tax=Chlamydia sp. 17-3921 TaxID=2675798 RepID=UPI0019192FEA|nr:aminoacyl-tRNA hydrolase [Chlamydia sp. 17-3921]
MVVKLIVAIGNPGKAYAFSRHNIGFLLADKLVEELRGSPFKPSSKNFSSIAKVETPSDCLVFIKPETFVNLSGKAVLSAKSFFNVDSEHLLVLADDVNHSFGKARLRYQAGSGGHKGIKSIVASLGSNNFWQLRLGIGRPLNDSSGLSDFVLGHFSAEEKEQLGVFFAEASTLFTQWCLEPRAA